MIDIKKAEKSFEKYLENYDKNDDKVKLKLVHTYGVVNASEYLAKELRLDFENVNLARLIALLHDIGRFEQSKMSAEVYDTADVAFFDHAKYGVKILFEDGLIRDFIEDTSYDNIIYKSILNHNRLEIEQGLKDKELLHTKIIRDTDKIDNFRVKLGTNDIEKISNEYISEHIYETFMSKKLINITENKTCLDRWSGYIAFIFDMNFNQSLKYLNSYNLVNKCFDRIEYKSQDTKNKIKNMKILANNYIKERLES